MQILGYIYKVSNTVNNLIYIGQTTLPIEIRWKQHINDAKRIDDRFHSALKKHGIDKFKCEVIERCPLLELNKRELYWIEFYDSYVEGYNNTRGGSILTKKGAFKLEQYSDDIIQLYLKLHYSCTTIAKNYGVTKKTISNLLKVCGIKIRTNTLDINSEELADIINRYNNGESYIKIGKDYLTTGGTIKALLQRNGVKTSDKVFNLCNLEKCQAIIDDFINSTLTYSEILKKHHIHYNTLKKLTENKTRLFKSRATIFTLLQKDLINKMYLKNATLTEIARCLNVTTKVIINYLIRNNIKTV